MSSKITRFLLLPTRFCLCLLSLLYWVLVYGTALITASMVLTRVAWRGLKNPRKTFQWTVRKSPPSFLRDPELGRHGYVRARSSGLRLHYVEKGDHKNPLMLFLHGFPENWYSWRYQLREFSAQYHTVAFDLRGCGDSAAPCRPEDYALEKLLDDIRDTISGLGHTSCVLVGHDWGGMLAWYFALERPDMVQRLIIMNAPHPASWLGDPAHRILIIEDPSTWTRPKGRPRSTWLWQMDGHFRSVGLDRESIWGVATWDPKEFRHVVDAVLRRPSQLLQAGHVCFFQLPLLPEIALSMEDFKLVRSLFCGRRLGIRNRARQLTAEQLEGYLYRLSQPGGLTAPLHYYRALLSNSPYKHQDAQVACMLIWGEDDGLLVEGRSGGGRPYARAAAAVHMIPHCSHWVQQDQPEVVNKLMSDFLLGLGVKQHHTHQQGRDGLQP